MTKQPPPKTFPNIQGRCPACRGDSLFIGSGGWITCSRIDCPNPSAADELLHGTHNVATLTAQLRVATAELERLAAGEEPATDPAVNHTPAQWIWKWNRATPEKRLQVAEAVMRDGATASDCRINGHTERIHDGRHAEMALNEVRQVVADMAAQGALQWAGWLRDAMKRGPKHCLLCAVEPKPAPAPSGPEAACLGFPDNCPNLRAVLPASDGLGGGVRCGCSDKPDAKEQPLVVPRHAATALHEALGQLLGDEGAQATGRVRALHREEYGCCAECTHESGVLSPCATVRALDGEEQPGA